MALRQLIPAFEPALSVLGERPAVLPRARKPVSVGFRGGADLKEVVSVISAQRNVMVDAAPGAGKTTALPAALVKATQALVLHVLPYDQMAAAQHDYLSRVCAEGEAPCLVLSPAEPYPRRGWVLTSAGCVVAKWLAAGQVVLPECFVLHDESHESGVYSAMLRRFGPVMASVKSYVQVSATLGLSSARSMETQGQVVDRVYDPEAFLDPWSVGQKGAPWGVESLDDHIMLVEDDKQRAAALVAAYNQCGVVAHRLHSGTTVKSLLEVLAAVRNEKISICALVVDSTYRSGYTMPVSTIVDNGKVKYMATSGGRPVGRERPIFETERVQTRARGGRMKGQVTEYWRPAGEPERKVCDLEPCELEAYALLMRVLGYAVPEEASDAAMAGGGVPRDLCGALRGCIPLAAMPKVAFVSDEEFRQPQGRVSPYLSDRVQSLPPYGRLERERSVERASQSVVASAFASTEPVSPRREELRVSPAAQRGLAVVDEGRSALRSMLDSVCEFGGIEVGEYYYAVGLSTQDTCCVSFPDGWDSVFRVVGRDKSGTAHLRWTREERSVAVSALVSCLNISTVEMRALSSALTQARAELGSREPTAVRRWVKSSAERLSELTSLASSCADLLSRFSDDFCTFRRVETGFPEEEGTVKQVYVDAFRALPVQGVGPPMEQVEGVRSWAGAVARDYDYHGNQGSRADAAMPLRAKGARPIPPLLAYLSGASLRSGVRRASTSSGSSGAGDVYAVKPPRKRSSYYNT